MKQNKIYVKFVIICIALLIGFIGIFLVADKIVKAEITQDNQLQINIPMQISEENWQEKKINSISIGNNTTTYIHSEDTYLLANQQRTLNLIGVAISDNGTTRLISFSMTTTPHWAEGSLLQVYYNYTENYIFDSVGGILINQGLTISDITGIKWNLDTEAVNYFNTNSNLLTIWGDILQLASIQLEKPTPIAINNTITWNYIEYAEYYNIYMGGNIIGQTEFNQWVVSANGNYTIQACTTLEGYSNSDISQVVQITSFNDLIGNGWNFYTLIGAVLDSELILVKAFLNYTVWGINLFQTLQIILTMCLVILIIKKFVVKG